MSEIDFHYETVDGITYRIWKDGTKEIMGWNYVGNPPRLGSYTPEQHIRHHKLEPILREIIDLSETNSALKEEVDKLVTFYYLLKNQDEKPLFYYQV